MNKICAPLLVLFLVFAAELVHVVSRAQAPAPPSPDYNAYYQIGPDSLAHDAVPKGEVRGPFALPSQAYPGTQHTYWVHVPAQYDPAVATSLMIFQDGQAFKDMDDNRGVGRDGAYDQRRDWFYQNVRLMQALTDKGYDVSYTWGMNTHGQRMGGPILPEMMRWLWRDHPVSTDVNDAVERSFNGPKKNLREP